MSVHVNLPGYSRLHFLRNAAIRTGVYTGVCLSLVFVAWLVIANHVPFLERFAMERNVAAVGVLCFLAAVPVLRFVRMPGYLLAASMVGWIIFSFVYRVLCLFFSKLNDGIRWHSASLVFILGSVVYLILTTLSWIASIIRRAREADVSHHQGHRPR